MRHTVVALQSAEDSLTEFYLNSPTPSAFTAAANRIETALQDDPELKGDYYEGLFVIRDYPLVAVYEVIPDDRLVRIVAFGVLKPKPSNGQGQ